MQMTRRTFTVVTAAATCGCALGGCASMGGGDVQPHDVDAGPADRFSKPGVYDAYRKDGFFVVNDGSTTFALSSKCTHRGCTVKKEEDSSFHCPCHGSEFDSTGHVTEGPAKRDLPRYASSTNSAGHLIVQVGTMANPA